MMFMYVVSSVLGSDFCKISKSKQIVPSGNLAAIGRMVI